MTYIGHTLSIKMKLFQQDIAFIIKKPIKGYKTATIQKQPREKKHVNVLWSAVKDFENNFAPKKQLIYKCFYNYVKKNSQYSRHSARTHIRS